MKVSMKTFMPAAAAALLTLGACSSVVERTEEYMKDRPQKEVDMLLSGLDGSFKQQAIVQSRLDSTAYRDIFNGTYAAKNSALVEEFNKIAALYRADASATYESDIFKSIRTKLINNGIKTGELKKIYHPKQDYVTGFQHMADDWAYRKFFQKIGILDSVTERQCDEVSEKIRP